MSDTPPDVAARYRALLLERSPAERMIMACAMFDSARHLMIAGIRADEPGISETELRVRVFERTYGRDFSGEARDRIRRAVRQAAGSQGAGERLAALDGPQQRAGLSNRKASGWIAAVRAERRRATARRVR